MLREDWVKKIGAKLMVVELPGSNSSACESVVYSILSLLNVKQGCDR